MGTHQTNLRFLGGTDLYNAKSDDSKISTRRDTRESSLASASEVVGAFGRMGSFWLCHQEEDNEISYTAAVPRGVAPGCQSEAGCPIFIATPSTAWPGIWEQTWEQRKDDLVFVGNGIPPDEFEYSTVIVPHYSVLQICQRNDTENPIGTSPGSPKTFLYGKHASYAARILEKYGVATEIVDAFLTIKVKATLKLAWASCMWLLWQLVSDLLPRILAVCHF